MKEIVEASTEFAKMGYKNQDKILNLSEMAARFQNIADSEVSAADAASLINSQLKAFGKEGLTAENVIDKINVVSNNFGVSSTDISSALTKTSGAMATYGNSMDETISLITAGTEVMPKQASKVARGWRTIGANVVKMAEDTDTWTAANKKVNVSLKDSEGNLRSTYEIMSDLYNGVEGQSVAWDELSEAEQSNIAVNIAGKSQMEVFAASMNNFSQAQKAFTTSTEDYMGSSAEENEKYLDSIEGRLQAFKSAWEKLSKDLINSDTIKTAISAATKLLEILDKMVDTVGALPTLGALFTGGRLGIKAVKGFSLEGIIKTLIGTNSTGTTGKAVNIMTNALVPYFSKLPVAVNKATDIALKKSKSTDLSTVATTALGFPFTKLSTNVKSSATTALGFPFTKLSTNVKSSFSREIGFPLNALSTEVKEKMEEAEDWTSEYADAIDVDFETIAYGAQEAEDTINKHSVADAIEDVGEAIDDVSDKNQKANKISETLENVGEKAEQINETKESLEDAQETIEDITEPLEEASVLTTAFNGALIGMATALAVIAGLEWVGKKIDEQFGLESTTKKVKKYNDELEETNDRIEELTEKRDAEGLTDAEKEELEILEAERDVLEDQVELYEKRRKKAASNVLTSDTTISGDASQVTGGVNYATSITKITDAQTELQALIKEKDLIEEQMDSVEEGSGAWKTYNEALKDVNNQIVSQKDKIEDLKKESNSYREEAITDWKDMRDEYGDVYKYMDEQNKGLYDNTHKYALLARNDIKDEVAGAASDMIDLFGSNTFGKMFSDSDLAEFETADEMLESMKEKLVALGEDTYIKLYTRDEAGNILDELKIKKGELTDEQWNIVLNAVNNGDWTEFDKLTAQFEGQEGKEELYSFLVNFKAQNENGNNSFFTEEQLNPQVKVSLVDKKAKDKWQDWKNEKNLNKSIKVTAEKSNPGSTLWDYLGTDAGHDATGKRKGEQGGLSWLGDEGSLKRASAYSNICINKY